MIHSQPKQTNTKPDVSKPGSESVHVDRRNDFGIAPGQTSEVRYASEAARNQDKGRLQERSSEIDDGRRDVGVGVNTGGAGAGSGGDIDVDIVGVGTGGSGISQTPVRKQDELQQHLVSGRVDRDRPATNTNPRLEPDATAAAETVGQLDDEGYTGADALRTQAGVDDPYQDAVSGEISADESNGTDNDEGLAESVDGTSD